MAMITRRLGRQCLWKQVSIAEGGFAKHMFVCLLARRKMQLKIKTAHGIIIKQKANTNAKRKGKGRDVKPEGVTQIDYANPKRK